MDEIRDAGGDAAEGKGQLKLDQSQAEVAYANFVLVAAAAEEIILSFGVRTGDEPAAKVGSKVILSPKNAKRFLAALSQSVRSYEERFGTIDATLMMPKEKPNK